MSEESTGAEVETATFTPDDVKKLQDRSQRMEALAKDWEVKAKKYEGILKDVDPDEYKTLKKALEDKDKELAAKDPAKLEELWNKKFDRFRTEVEGEKSELQKELEKLRNQNKSLAVTDKVMTSISKHFHGDVLDIVKGLVEKHCDLDADGNIIARDANGEPLYSPKNRALPMNIEEFGEWLRDQRKSLAVPTHTGGTKDVTDGQRVSSRAGGKIPTTYDELAAMPNPKEVFSKLTSEQQMAIARTTPMGGPRL